MLMWLRKMFDRSNDPVRHCDLYLDKAAGSCAHVDGFLCDFPSCSMLKDYRERKANAGVTPTADASAWWALVMGAAASIEDAANCLRDPDAKKQADGAARHYREAAQKLMAACGVAGKDHQTGEPQP